jgi:hypothetical protein
MLLLGLALVSTMLTIIQKQIHAVADDVKGTIDKDYQQALEELGEEDGGPIDHIDGEKAANGRAIRAVDFERGHPSKGDSESKSGIAFLNRRQLNKVD